MVILVILHQHSLAGSIMGVLDLDWYSRLLGVKFALLSHSDLLCFGLPHQYTLAGSSSWDY